MLFFFVKYNAQMTYVFHVNKILFRIIIYYIIIYKHSYIYAIYCCLLVYFYKTFCVQTQGIRSYNTSLCFIEKIIVLIQYLCKQLLQLEDVALLYISTCSIFNKDLNIKLLLVLYLLSLFIGSIVKASLKIIKPNDIYMSVLSMSNNC